MSDVDLRGLLCDDEAVSSVIGVVLMVAITIVLAAAIGVFVLGIGTGLTDTTPQTRFTMATDTDPGGANWVNVSADGGDTFEAENTYVTVGDTKAWEGGSGPTGNFRTGEEWTGEVSTGDNLAIINDSASGSISDGDEVQVIWTSGDDRSAILYSETV